MTRTGQPARDELLRSLLRLEAAIAGRPGFGHVTQSSTTRCDTGVACATREGDHLVHADLPRGLGGHDSAPSPGTLVRAALGSCLAMGYRLRAARYDIPLDAIVVTVETDSVLASMLDPAAVDPPGFTGIRVDVRLDSPARARDLSSLIDEADLLSPILDVVNRSNLVERSVHLTGRGR